MIDDHHPGDSPRTAERPWTPTLSRRDFAHTSAALAIAAAAPAAVAAAADAADVELGPGDHPVDRDRMIAGVLTLRPGARLVIARGATLTLLGDLHAPAAAVFMGEGLVDLSRSRVLAVRPEWWGAAADDPAVDSVPAIEAALAAHPAVVLGLGDYHLRRTLVLDRPNRRLWGVGRTKDARGTRLLLGSGDGAVLRVGLERTPALVNDYLWGVDVRWLELGRSEAPHGRATGLEIRHVVDGRFEGLRANEHAIGVSLRGAVRTLMQDCAAFRSQFAGTGGEPFVGFDLDGTHPPIPTGANASLYLVDCVTNAARPAGAPAIGCRILGAFSDTFLIRFETNQLTHGVVVDGAGQHGRYAQLDLHLDTPVLDQCAAAGIAISDLGETALVDISSPWIAVPATATAALGIVRSGGAVSVMGGQLVATGNGTPAGLLMDGAQGVTLTGVKMLDVVRPVVAHAATGFDLGFVALSARAGEAAVSLAGCSHGTVRARLPGRAGGFATGIAADAACHALLIETVGLSAAAVPVRVAAGSAAATNGVVMLP